MCCWSLAGPILRPTASNGRPTGLQTAGPRPIRVFLASCHRVLAGGEQAHAIRLGGMQSGWATLTNSLLSPPRSGWSGSSSRLPGIGNSGSQAFFPIRHPFRGQQRVRPPGSRSPPVACAMPRHTAYVAPSSFAQRSPLRASVPDSPMDRSQVIVKALAVDCVGGVSARKTIVSVGRRPNLRPRARLLATQPKGPERRPPG